MDAKEYAQLLKDLEADIRAKKPKSPEPQPTEETLTLHRTYGLRVSVLANRTKLLYSTVNDLQKYTQHQRSILETFREGLETCFIISRSVAEDIESLQYEIRAKIISQLPKDHQ